MVGLATRASNNHIGRSVFGGKENITNLGYNIEKNVDEGEQNSHRYYRIDLGPLTVQLFFF